jgi:intein-encoded DNA endonuclease-like protein
MEIERRYNVRISKAYVSIWFRKLHNPRNSVKMLPEYTKPSGELAYIAGTIAGHRTTRTRKSKEGHIYYYFKVEV